MYFIIKPSSLLFRMIVDFYTSKSYKNTILVTINPTSDECLIVNGMFSNGSLAIRYSGL